MFDYNAKQVFVIQPRNTGGGILSFILSLDSNTASLNFKNASESEKLKRWTEHLSKPITTNAHLYNSINVGQPNHIHNLEHADRCSTYVHKAHFYDLDGYEGSFQNKFFAKLTGQRVSIGIHLTSKCVERLMNIRPMTTRIDFYQSWVYAHQAKLMGMFYNVSTLHQFSFSDMLNEDLFIDHLRYCKDLLNSDVNVDIARVIIKEWHEKILKI